jgi:hypothetical protein
MSNSPENRQDPHDGWRIGFKHTTHSLINGLHLVRPEPGAVASGLCRYLQLFLSSYEDAVFRLKTFVDRAAISTLTADIFDNAATGQGLLNFFQSTVLRGNY